MITLVSSISFLIGLSSCSAKVPTSSSHELLSNVPETLLQTCWNQVAEPCTDDEIISMIQAFVSVSRHVRSNQSVPHLSTDIFKLVEDPEGASNKSLESRILDEAGLSSWARWLRGEQIANRIRFNGTRETTASDVFHLTKNSEQDLATLCNSLKLYTALVLVVVLLFSCCLRTCFPLVYTNNALPEEDMDNELTNRVPEHLRPSSSMFGWLFATIHVTVDDTVQVAGLDMAMLLEFTHFSMRVLAYVGLPILLVTCPMNYFFGGGAAENDRLGRVGWQNVTEGNRLWWLHVVAVWFVVLRVRSLVFDAQTSFMERRFDWVWSMEPPRSTTALVEHVPVGFRSQQALTDFINNDVFARDVVKKVWIVKNDKSLQALLEEEKRLKEHIGDAHEEGDYPSSTENKAKASHRQKLHRLKTVISQEQERINNASHDDVGQVSGTAFVTFKEKRDTVAFLHMRLTHNIDEFLLSMPPEPFDVNYTALLMNDSLLLPMHICGVLCLVLLFIFFVPLVATITTFMKLATLATYLPVIEHLVNMYPDLLEWDMVVGSIALNLCMGLLPTLLMWIFGIFFPDRASSLAQLNLQRWYFRFQLLFVVILTSLGSSLLEVSTELVESPAGVVRMLAYSLPSTSHFYLNYCVLQWGTQALGLLRMANLAKYLAAILYTGEVNIEQQRIRAKVLSEPENQDAYGIGARSADTSLFLAMAIIFCNITPCICLVAFATFCIARLALGYLVCFAEVRKPDLGGLFWCAQLRQLLNYMILYIILMAGVLARLGSRTQGAIVLLLLPYQIYSIHKFHDFFYIRYMPMSEFGKREGADTKSVPAVPAVPFAKQTSWFNQAPLLPFMKPIDEAGQDVSGGVEKVDETPHHYAQSSLRPSFPPSLPSSAPALLHRK